MIITDKKIDGGKAFDFGKTSLDYAKYRDIYPKEFYDKIIERGLCIKGHKVLDIGTGTGVLPRNMYKYGAGWTGTDISKEQIDRAKSLSDGMNINYYVMPTEKLNFSDNSFDVITACQCFWYFNHEEIIPNLCRMLKPNGRILILYMAWLPFEDKVAKKSEKLILKYNPKWSGAGEKLKPIFIPECYNDKFDLIFHDEYKLKVRFTAESWNGRLKTCRGIGASLNEEQIAKWEREHLKILSKIATDEFDILHYVAIAELKMR